MLCTLCSLRGGVPLTSKARALKGFQRTNVALSKEARSRQGRGIPTKKSYAPSASSQPFLCRGGTHLGAEDREAIWYKMLTKAAAILVNLNRAV